MGRISRWLFVLFGLVLVMGLGLVAWRHFSRPFVLKVAVGPAESEDAQLMATFARTLSASHWGAVRLNVETTSGPDEAVKKLTSGEVQFAVTRADGPPSDRIRSVAILHTDPVVVVATEQPKLSDLGDLKDRPLGVIGPPSANDALVATLRKHYSLGGPLVAIPPNPSAVAAAIKDKKASALLLVAPATRSADIGKAWIAVRTATRRKMSIVPIESAAAIAASNDAYEAGEISAGQFGGSPPLPADDVTTLQVSTYLVADRSVRNVVVTYLTRALFEERQEMIPDAPSAALIKAASTDKDARFPVHPGAKAYYEGEETSLMDRYGDLIYYIPVVLGALGSLLVGLRRFLLGTGTIDIPLSARIGTLLSAIKAARTPSDLDKIRDDVDALVMTLMTGDTSDQENTAAAVAISYLNDAIADRRDAITQKA